MKNTQQPIKGVFENLSPTPQLAEGYTMLDALKSVFKRPKTVIPPSEIPSVKTNLKTYYSEKPSVIWFGHSSYLVHFKGTNILVDPVFSGHASPFSFQIKAFKGADIYKVKDMPQIDCLILTHNHYDHLDYKTIKLLAAQTKMFVMPLSVGKSLKDINIPSDKIIELDWWQSINEIPGIKLTATPARHFSGRGFKRNTSLWASYVLELNGYKIYVGGDSGYDSHFKDIGQKFGPFDLALLECGQYSVMWPYIHSMPEELVTEGIDLNAKVVMPIHWGKFALSNHEWDEPVKRFVAAVENTSLNYTTPLIGEPVVLDKYYPKNKWWE